MRFLIALLSLSVLSLAAPDASAKPKPGPVVKKIPANQARIKQMHDAKVKRGTGLPTFSFGRGYSTIETKFHEPFRVSPPVEWVTDYGEADGSAYRVRLSQINFPDGKKRSLYTDAQKAEVFKNLVGHLYALKGPQLDKVLASSDGKELFAKFREGIDGPGFDFPMAIPAPR
jgi:hypothetical protein